MQTAFCSFTILLFLATHNLLSTHDDACLKPLFKKLISNRYCARGNWINILYANFDIKRVMWFEILTVELKISNQNVLLLTKYNLGLRA